MFEVNHAKAKITSLNPRTEKHGDQLKQACDIGLRLTLDNAALDLLHPDLKSAHYKKGDPKQGELIEDLRSLKFALFDYPFKYKYIGLGYESYFNYGMDGAKDLHFVDNQVDNFKIECKEGGSVEFNLRIIAHPTPAEMGELYELNGNEIELTLMAPSQVDADEPQAELI